jgi:hypothetical protein
VADPAGKCREPDLKGLPDRRSSDGCQEESNRGIRTIQYRLRRQAHRGARDEPCTRIGEPFQTRRATLARRLQELAVTKFRGCPDEAARERPKQDGCEERHDRGGCEVSRFAESDRCPIS